MQEPSHSIFNKAATEKLRSPDDLDKYIRVTNPTVWMVLVACIALLAGTLAWAVFGSVTTSVSATGVLNVENRVVCFLNAENAAKVHLDDVANVGGERMTVGFITPVPLSKDEASNYLFSDYLTSALVKDDWSYMLVFEGDTSNLVPDKPVYITITTERISPISLILGGRR